MLSLQNYSVLRDDVILFQPVSQEMKAGELWVIRGENGRGKTTLLRALAGIYQEFQGEAKWNLAQVQNLLFLGHKLGIHSALTVEENLELLCGTLGFSYDRQLLQELLDQFKMGLYEETLAARVSAGQFRKIALCLLFHPEAQHRPWLLDEPFTSLDADTTKLIEKKCLAHINNGQCILMTSHQPLLLESMQSSVKELYLHAVTEASVDSFMENRA